MTNSFVIGIDSSTTGCKAIAWGRDGEALAEGRCAYPLLRPHPSWAEQDAVQWWSGVCSALKDLSIKIELSRAEAVCITAQRESFLLVDAQVQPIRNAILWLDERSRDQVKDLERAFGRAELHQLTGKPPSMSLALPKILWLNKNEPGIAQEAARLLDTHAFLVHRLTGKFVTSLACADPMGFLDMRAQSWAAGLIPELSLRMDQFPDLVQPGAIIGPVSRSGAADSGLPEGLPVVAGAGDGQCAGLGANAIGRGRIYLNLGTAVVSGAFSSCYLADPAFRTHFAPIPGGYFFETVIRGGVSTVGWFVDQFGTDLRSNSSSRSPEEQLEAAAAEVPPGSLGLVVVPYWNSVMNPYWDPSATGITIGWTAAHTRAHFYRAILEGIGFEQRLAGEGMRAALGQPFSEYIAVGGGSRSHLWCQTIANITGIPVARSSTTEASCLGAGILAAAAAGWYPAVAEAANAMTGVTDRFIPESEITPFYERLYRDVYLPLFPTLQHLVDRLTKLSHPES